MEKIRIMLVDDHEVVRTGLRTFLETQDNMEVVSEASTGEEAIQFAMDCRPEVIVMDLSMPGIGGLEATRRMVVMCPECRVLVLTVHNDQQYFFEMMAAGAVGYVTKQAAADELVDAIEAVSQGQVYLQPILARWLLEDYRRLLTLYEEQEHLEEAKNAHTASLEELSQRERQVLRRVADGMSNNQIGEELGISPKTVARHRERIMNKLNLHSTTELVKFAVRTGLIELG
jgi:two-component system response regulator NreC